MKKIISFLLTITILIPAFSIGYANDDSDFEIILNQNYSDIQTNVTPKNMLKKGDGSVFYVTNDELRKSLVVKNRWSDTSVSYNTSVSGGIVWIENKVKFEDFNTDKKIIEIRDNVTQTLVYVDRSGMIKDGDGYRLCHADKNKWIKFTVEINMDTHKYNIYVNGNMRAERLNLSDKIKNIKNVGFTSQKNSDAQSSMKNNYIRVYRSNELKNEADFPLPPYNTESKKLRNDKVKQVEENTQLYYSESFEDTAEGNRPGNITATAGKQFVKKEENGNHYFNASWDKESSLNINFETGKIGASNLDEKIVIQADVQISKNSDDILLFCIRDADNPYHFSRTVCVKSNGNLALYNGQVLGNNNCKNKWVTLAITCDFAEHTHNIYINDKLIAEKIPFQDINTINKVSMFRCQSNTNAAKGNIMLDNIMIYSGNKPVKPEEMESSSEEMPEREEKWDKEINSAPLNFNLKNCIEAVSYPSQNPSRFLQNYDSIKNTYADTICVVANNSNMWIRDRKYKTPYNIKWIDEHFIAPAEFLAALSDESCIVDNDTVKIGKDFSAKAGEKKIKIGSQEFETKVPVKLIDNKIYIPLEEYVVNKLKKYYCETCKGLALIADKQFNIKKRAHTENVIQMLAYIVLDFPDANKIKESFEKSNMQKVHPRIYATKEKYNEIIEFSKTDDILKSRCDALKTKADSILDMKFVYNKTSGRGDFSHCEALYWAWLLTGDDKYAKKAEELALLIAESNEWWSGSFFLATSFDMLICATVYDLFYDYLSQETKDILAKAVMEKGLAATKEHYYGSSSDWPKRKTNWNTVCNGGAMVAASTFIGEGYDDSLCLDVMEKSFVSLANEMHAYAPYGSLFEGIGYWAYGTGYLLRGIEAYSNLLGTDFGLSDYPGFMEAGYFPFYMETWEDKWPLHDDTLKSGINNIYASWYAYKTHDLMLQKMRHEQIKRKKYIPDFFDIIYYIPETMPNKIDTPLDKNYSYSELATSRSDWGKSAFFMGVHAGANNFEHGQQDLGNFIYEAFGIRFAQDMGRDNYNLPNYFNEGTTKLNLYVHRAEAHNVYVINPDESSGQIWRAASEIEVLENKPKGIIYRVDMTPAYFTQLKEGIRGYMLTNDRSVMVIQDEIIPNEKDDEYKWFWTTDAEITINNDNSVTLTRNYKTVTLYFDSNVNLEFEKGITEPLPTSPNPPGQLKIGNKANKLTVTFESSEDKVYLRCTAVPYGHEYERGEIKPINEWNIPDGEISDYTAPDMIYINGEPLENFEPDVFDYTQYFIKYKGMPEVTASGKGEITVRQAEDKYKTAVITVKNEKGIEKVYTVTFQSDIANGVPKGKRLEVKSVVAEDNDGNLPEYVLDDNLNTRWSGKTVDKGWIELDLGEEKEVDSIALAIFNGDTRAAIFDILVSSDKEEYTTVVKGGSTTGTTKEIEHVVFEPVKARYIKIVGYGATTSRYNSYTEIHPYKLD